MQENKSPEIQRARVMVVDDNIPYRWSLMEALNLNNTLEIVEEASDGNEAVEKARTLKPDVIIMDLNMPDCDGVEATRRLQSESPGINILMNTVSDSDTDLFNALKAGARGYLLKDESPGMIEQAIHYAARGGIIVSPAMAIKLLNEFKAQRSATGAVSEVGAVEVSAETVAVEEPEPEVTVAEEQEAEIRVEEPLAEAEAQAEEPTAEAALETAPQPPQRIAETVTGMPPSSADSWVPDAELVISPPLEPRMVLMLQQWLKATAKADIDRIFASLGDDTVLNVTFRQPLQLLGMLKVIPYVAEVGEEPYPKSGKKPPGSSTGSENEGEEQKVNSSQAVRNRFRLVLKAN